MSEKTEKEKPFITKVTETIILTLVAALVLGFCGTVWRVAISYDSGISESNRNIQELSKALKSSVNVLTDEIAKLNVVMSDNKYSMLEARIKYLESTQSIPVYAPAPAEDEGEGDEGDGDGDDEGDDSMITSDDVPIPQNGPPIPDIYNYSTYPEQSTQNAIGQLETERSRISNLIEKGKSE